MFRGFRPFSWFSCFRVPADKELYQQQTWRELVEGLEATDRQIDGLGYELYGLTEEEIGVVEGRNH